MLNAFEIGGEPRLPRLAGGGFHGGILDLYGVNRICGGRQPTGI
jgi:hypothetical protein